MIKLDRLYLQNFFSHKESRINISDKKGLVLIEGKNSDGRYDSNGSGKSTILEGIVYALSGTTLRGVGVNDVVNRNAKKDTLVSLSFYANDSEYCVERYRKDSVEGDKLKVWDIGEDVSGDISKRLNKDTQQMLDSIVDIPYEILINTMLLGEGLSSRFTQLSDADKKSLIESTLNLSYDLSKSRDSVSAALKQMKLKRASVEGQISTLSSIVKEDPHDAEESMKSNRTLLSASKSEQESLLARIPNTQVEIDTLQQKISVLMSSIDKHNFYTQRLRQLDESTAHYIEEMKRVEGEEKPICSLCRQILESADSRESVLSTYKSYVDANTADMELCRKELSQLPDISLLSSTLETLQSQLDQKISELSEMTAKSNSLHTRIAVIEKDILTLESTIHNYEGYQSQLADKEQELKSIEKEISEYEYFYKLYSPTGIMVYVLEEAIEYINSRIRVYTDILLDKSYMLVLEKGKIALKDTKGSSYQSLSNGEKRRLDLCIQFSLHDYTHIYCGNSCNVLFLDEVLDTLDSTGVNNIIEVLSLKREYCKLDSIFVISHNQSLKEYFDEVVTVIKDADGNSYIK